MGQTVLFILIAVGFIFIFGLAREADKHLKWFRSLKPGDRVLVRIYSKYCECAREAVVIKSCMDNGGKYIEADLLPDVTQTCSLCDELNSIEIDGVTSFGKGDVTPITKKSTQYNTRRI
jgi:hypothetical protein